MFNIFYAVIGGRGGRGQDGAAGLIYQDPNVTALATGLSESGEPELRQRAYRRIAAADPKGSCATQEFHIPFMNYYYRRDCTHTWHVYGSCSGTAKDGGAGGIGGSPGTVKIFELTGSSSIKTAIENGAAGENGKAGAINTGKPKRIKMKYESANYTVRCDTATTSELNGTWYNIQFDFDDTCEDITAARDGGNAVDIVQPEKPFYLDPSIPINAFRTFVSENLGNTLKRDNLNAVIELMSRNKQRWT